MLKSKYVISLVVAMLVSFPVFAQDGKPVFTTGTLTASVYKNPYFGVTVKIPGAWQALDENGKKRLEDTGAQAVARDVSAKAGKAVELAMKTTTFNLLTLAKPSPDLPGYAAFIVVAERIPPELKEPSVYLSQLRRMYQMDKTTLAVDDIRPAILSGRQFATLSAVQRAGDMDVKQKVYAAVHGGFVLVFILTYVADSQLREMTGMLNGSIDN